MEKIALFLVIGQSNSTPIVGYLEELEAVVKGEWQDVSEKPVMPEPGTVFAAPCVTELTEENDVCNLITSGQLGGYFSSFGKTWYNMTGEKAVFLLNALGATGMHEWAPNPFAYSCPCVHNGGGKLLKTAMENYKKSEQALSRRYEIARHGYLWNQGEHDEYFGNKPFASLHTAADYYRVYRDMHDTLVREIAPEFAGMIVVRSDAVGDTAQDSMSFTIARAAQYQLCQSIRGLDMISRMPETCDGTMMSPAGIHYSQKTFNAMGQEAAWNLGKVLSGGYVEPERYTVYAKNGEKLAAFSPEGKLSSGEAVLRESENTGWLLVRAEPVCSDRSVTFSVENGTLTVNAVRGLGKAPIPGRYTDGFGSVDWKKLKEDSIEELKLKCNV